MKKYFGVILLLIGALTWGMAFVVQSSASSTITTLTFNAPRLALATITVLIFVIIRAIVLKAQGKPQVKLDKRTVIGGLATGVAFTLAANLQQLGLSSYPEGVAAAGRGGFITATYVVMIAVVSLIRTRKAKVNVLISVVGCLGGMYMLCFSGGFEGLYLGDLFVFLGAICYTVHVLTIDAFSKQDSFYVCLIMFATSAMLTTIAMFIMETPTWEMIEVSWMPILYAGIMASAVAYTLQIIGQRTVEPTIAGIAMSLESVFGALFGWMILNEQLSPIELTGCALVFLSVLFAQIEFKKKVKEEQPLEASDKQE